jgi:hypothetical protein
MKKLSLIFLIGLLIGSTILTSCKKDDDDDPIIGYPSLDFKGGTAYTFEDVTITTNDQILVGILAAMHTGTQEPLVNFKLTIVSGSSTTTLVDSTFNAQSFNADYNISFSQTGVATLTAKITDNAGRSEEASFIITVEQGGVRVKKNSEVLMGSFNDPAGSFYSTTEEAVYRVAEAKERQDKIDFIFFRGETQLNQNTFAAPDDEAVNTIETFQLNEWTTKNQTRFMMSQMTAAEFDAIGEFHIFPEFTGTLTRANQLQNGNVVYFRTEAGKHGYIKVIDLYNRGDVALLEVIVEE